MRFIITLLLITNLLSAGDKIALLIGNNDYSFQPLDNPLNDVDGIYKTLREIGFKESNIKVLKNVSKNKMENELANFSQRASSAEIALVYFSGHGMQVNNTNYMFPANTTATKPIHLRTLVDLDYFIESASSAKYGIILVDACRNNPLVKYFQNGKYKGSTAKKGLGQVTPTVGQVVIGFATSAGDTADDGSGSMSPYARALSVRLKEPNKDITKVLGLVALDVSAKYEQNPVIRTNLAYDVCLTGNCEISEVKVVEKIVYRDRIEQPTVTQTRRVDSSTNNAKGITTIDGLMYQNQPFSSQDKTNYDTQKNGNRVWDWAGAKKYCEGLMLGDYRDWRLPRREELQQLANIELYHAYGDYKGGKEWFEQHKEKAQQHFNTNKHKRNSSSRGDKYFVKKAFVENMPPLTRKRKYVSFWSSTERDSSYAWFIFFGEGNDGWYSKYDKRYILCVR